jgi:signal transduction histidine kinase
LDEVRARAHDFRPSILDDIGLMAAIHSFAADWTSTFGLPVSLDAEPESGERLLADMETALFRIVQEGLMNAGKHAQARSVHVSLSFPDGKAFLVIQDDGIGCEDGIGFDSNRQLRTTRHGGLGPYGMPERAAPMAC